MVKKKQVLKKRNQKKQQLAVEEPLLGRRLEEL
jgi:hypothetical protein